MHVIELKEENKMSFNILDTNSLEEIKSLDEVSYKEFAIISSETIIIPPKYEVVKQLKSHNKYVYILKITQSNITNEPTEKLISSITEEERNRIDDIKRKDDIERTTEEKKLIGIFETKKSKDLKRWEKIF